MISFEYRGEYEEGTSPNNWGVHLGNSEDYIRVIFSKHHLPEILQINDVFNGQNPKLIRIKYEPIKFVHKDNLELMVNNYLTIAMTGLRIKFVLDSSFDVNLVWLGENDSLSQYVHGLYDENANTIFCEPPSPDSLPLVLIHEFFHFLERTHWTNECSENLMHDSISETTIFLSPLQILKCHNLDGDDYVPNMNIFPLLNPYL